MMGLGDGSGVSWTICKILAPGCRPITTATVQHLITQFLQAICYSWRPTQCRSTEGTQSCTYNFFECPVAYFCTTMYSVSPKILQTWGCLIFSPNNFTCLLYIRVYVILPNFIQLSGNVKIHWTIVCNMPQLCESWDSWIKSSVFAQIRTYITYRVRKILDKNFGHWGNIFRKPRGVKCFAELCNWDKSYRLNWYYTNNADQQSGDEIDIITSQTRH